MPDHLPLTETLPKRLRPDKLRKWIEEAQLELASEAAKLPERVRLYELKQREILAERRTLIEAKEAHLLRLEQAQKDARAERRVEVRLAEMRVSLRPELRAELRAELLRRELAGTPAEAGSQEKRKRGRPK